MSVRGRGKSVLWAAILAIAAVECSLDSPPAFGQSAIVRLALVNVPDELLRPLLPDFQKQTGIRADIVYTGNDPFAVAREGKADLVI